MLHFKSYRTVSTLFKYEYIVYQIDISERSRYCDALEIGNPNISANNARKVG